MALTLIERDTIASVNQNIRLILTTLKGSDIHRPDFGSSLMLWIDEPLTVINQGRIKAEIVDAIEMWEPRCSIKEVDLKKEYANIRIRIVYELKDTGEVVTTWL